MMINTQQQQRMSCKSVSILSNFSTTEKTVFSPLDNLYMIVSLLFGVHETTFPVGNASLVILWGVYHENEASLTTALRIMAGVETAIIAIASLRYSCKLAHHTK